MTKTKTDPRSPAKKAKDAAYAALPPVRIVRPLKFIDEATGSFVRSPDGRGSWQASRAYIGAWHSARAGKGLAVQSLARSLAGE